jgi:hypothetical protein
MRPLDKRPSGESSMLRSRHILLLGALLLSPLGCNRPDVKGEAETEAERDIAAGTLRIKTYGYPVEWIGKYRQLMHNRLGVELMTVAGCVVTEELVENVRGYNRRMKQEIAARFGPNALDDIRKEAEEEYNREHPGS